MLRFVDGRSPARYARVLGIAAAAALLVIPAAAAAAHYSANDFNNDSVELNYAKDLLAPLPQGSILLMRGDNNYTGVVYAQLVDHYRPDVIALDTELLKLGTYVNQAKQEHPSLLFPFAAYKPGTNTSQLNQFVRANLAQGHPVFVVGKQQETSFGKPFSTEYWGLTTRIEPKGSAPDPSAYEASSPKVFAALHWPTKVYPATSWESVIDQAYALAAFQFAVGVQQDDGASQAPLIERMYQIAIKFDPTLAGAYKNYGYLLDNLKRDPALDHLALDEVPAARSDRSPGRDDPGRSWPGSKPRAPRSEAACALSPPSPWSRAAAAARRPPRRPRPRRRRLRRAPRRPCAR